MHAALTERVIHDRRSAVDSNERGAVSVTVGEPIEDELVIAVGKRDRARRLGAEQLASEGPTQVRVALDASGDVGGDDDDRETLSVGNAGTRS
jgi:hypothetical protein